MAAAEDARACVVMHACAWGRQGDANCSGGRPTGPSTGKGEQHTAGMLGVAVPWTAASRGCPLAAQCWVWRRGRKGPNQLRGLLMAGCFFTMGAECW